ncbi:hypothetical protein J0J21_22980, partial [Vibrio vulnificus]|uniref:hypothetical protein n=1 Tax=Vibrio vulnificus TaxID=672 RepID=UPI0019D42E1C
MQIIPLNEYERLQKQNEETNRKLQELTDFVRQVFQGLLPPNLQAGGRSGENFGPRELPRESGT